MNLGITSQGGTPQKQAIFYIFYLFPLYSFFLFPRHHKGKVKEDRMGKGKKKIRKQNTENPNTITTIKKSYLCTHLDRP
jgi:hypothetical protein